MIFHFAYNSNEAVQKYNSRTVSFQNEKLWKLPIQPSNIDT